MAKPIDDAGFPTMPEAHDIIESWLPSVDTKVLLALFVIVEGADEDFYEMLAKEVYKFAPGELDNLGLSPKEVRGA